MCDSKQISAILKETLNGDPWYGPGIHQILDGLNAEQLLANPIPNTHNIAQILMHISTWHNVVGERICGQPVREIDDSEDWPKIPFPAKFKMDTFMDSFKRNGLKIIDRIGQLDQASLQQQVPGADWSILYGILQHDAYHAGQIALLVKLVKK